MAKAKPAWMLPAGISVAALVILGLVVIAIIAGSKEDEERQSVAERNADTPSNESSNNASASSKETNAAEAESSVDQSTRNGAEDRKAAADDGDNTSTPFVEDRSKKTGHQVQDEVSPNDKTTGPVATTNTNPVDTPTDAVEETGEPVELISPTNDETVKKHPVPSDAQQTPVFATLQEAFNISETRTAEQSLTLARELFELAKEAQDPVEKFVLLRRTLTYAGKGGDAQLVLSAVGEIDRHFQIDRFEIGQNALLGFAAQDESEEAMRSLTEATIDFIDEAIAAGRVDVASKLTEAVYDLLVAAPRATDLRKRVYDERERVRELFAQWQKIQQARARLESNPDDPHANLLVGKWLCFAKRDWDSGLPLLAKSGDETLRSLAAEELSRTGENAGDQLALADAWGDAAENAEADDKGDFLARAHDWYRLAQSNVNSSLDEQRIERRLEEIGEISRPSKGQQPLDSPRPVHQGPVDKWKLALTLPGFSAGVRAVDFSDDGKLLAATDGNKVQLIDVQNRKHLNTIAGHSRAVRDVAFSPGGSVLATGSEDGSARLWEVPRGRPLGVVSHKGKVVSVAFTPDGKTLASAADYPRLSEVPSAKERYVYELPTKGGGTFVREMQLSPDGNLLAAAVRAPSGGTTIRLFPLGSTEMKARFPGADLIAFSPDGRYLVTGDGAKDSRIHLFDLATGAKLDLAVHPEGTRCADFHPTGRVLATGGVEGTIRLWSMPTGSGVAELKGHDDAVLSLDFSDDSRLLASGGKDKTLRLWLIDE